MSGPKLLMIDELSLGLAPKLAEEILDRLTAVAQQGTALLVVEQEDPRVREAYLGIA